MKTAGQVLQETRIQARLEIEDIAKSTKIQPFFLRAIEADDYSHLPSGTVARGFIRNYANYLRLSPETLLAIFRRDFIETSQGQIVPRSMIEPAAAPPFWTPKTTIIAAVSALFGFFAVYLGYQYTLLLGPPSLHLDRPAPDLVTSEEAVVISGRTDPEATLSVNGQLVALDKGGTFFFRLPLKPGLNSISVTARSAHNRGRVITRNVTLTKSP